MGTLAGTQDVRLPDRYLPIRRIATGGMASVWCAHDGVLGRRVAIKILSERYTDDPVAIARFKREARAAARLSGHPHVVTIYDVGQLPRGFEDGDQGRPFIVMEFLAGGTLADALRVGAVSRDDVVRWMREAASALDYAHGQGVLHRDIKLVNLLLDRDRTLHVADFGIARIGTDDTLTGSGEVFGTAAYLAPERALGRPATEASDRYSLAVAAFELLTGQRPFTGGPLAAQARQHLEDAPPRASERNPGLPPAVDDVLARGMAKSPEERWPTAAAFADALEDSLGIEMAPTVAMGVGSRRSATPAFRAGTPASREQTQPRVYGRRRRSGRAFALAAIAAAVIGIVAIALGRQGGTPDVRSVSAPKPHTTATAQAKRSVRAAPRPKPRPTQIVTGTAAARTTPTPTADSLEARGHALMAAGNYAAAIPVLRQALATAPRGSLTYAYALFDLAHSLRVSGDPRAAIPLLWQRLQIPNQTEVVRRELQLALLAVGAQQQTAPPAPPGKHDKGKHKGQAD